MTPEEEYWAGALLNVAEVIAYVMITFLIMLFPASLTFSLFMIFALAYYKRTKPILHN